MAPTPTYLLGFSHALVGLSALIAPLTTARLFKLGAVPSTVFTSRMLGSRDLVLGGTLLLLATAPKEQRRAVLLATNVTNAVDMVAALVSYAEGNLTGEALALLLGSAGLLVGLGVWDLGSS